MSDPSRCEERRSGGACRSCRAYVDARYDPKFAITNEELAAIAVHVRELRSRVEMVCRGRIEAMTV